ncbi:MAG: hypothetical protein DSZ00_10655 [Gammaproteobacteria bacterium]|nr:MAG: hypothetical protein DSZ00_10655 [Gammaproteobacteria bacterium]RTZ74955.1 MAG: hypothetical protein DSZ02_04350 [Gammaproteobacteria bacterium]RTZ76550.1 MAG: hypothetical protein DSZ01_07980 [Gammaproteobacteria bacterium]
MKCFLCGGEMFRGTAPFHVDRKGVHVSLDEVPAWVCSQCGEVFFEESEVKAMQELIQAVEAQSQKLQGAA